MGADDAIGKTTLSLFHCVNYSHVRYGWYCYCQQRLFEIDTMMDKDITLVTQLFCRMGMVVCLQVNDRTDGTFNGIWTITPYRSDYRCWQLSLFLTFNRTSDFRHQFNNSTVVKVCLPLPFRIHGDHAFGLFLFNAAVLIKENLQSRIALLQGWDNSGLSESRLIINIAIIRRG